MSQPSDDETAAPSPQAGRAVAGLAKLTDRADLTALLLFDEVVDGASARQALFSGVLFRNCTFRQCNFSRADFEGAVFEDCVFEACDFSVADFRSVEAARTRFMGCNFDEGSARSCRYTGCVFESCSVHAHSFEENKIFDSRFVECSFQRSTLLHCDFTRTQFNATDLADCTAQFHLFSDCDFHSSRINAEAVGLTFGLTRQNLAATGLVWRGLGVEQVEGGSDLPQDLCTTYEARGWIFGAGILRLNFNLLPTHQALGEIFATIEKEAHSELPVKLDEIRFLSRVIERLSTDARLPFVSIDAGLDAIITCADLQDRKNEEAFRPLYHALKDAEYSELVAIEKSIAPLQGHGAAEVVTAKFTFSEKPSRSFFVWLTELQSEGALPGPAPRLLRTSVGSYIEILSLSVATLSSVLVCLGLLERILDRLVYIRARGALLLSGTLPATIRRRALQPMAPAPQSLLRELRGYLDRANKSPDFPGEVKQFTEKLTKVEVGADPEDLSGETIVEAS
jgi:uncharacterized protein YjbI with pentapeptide repeats